MKYQGQVYRPPSEAYSYILQATIGCSHNKCTFCYMYGDDQFRIRPIEELKKDLDMARSQFSKVRRIFIADGDALIMKFEDLVELMNYIGKLFPETERIGIYGSPKSILLKSKEELEKLRDLNLGIIYLGVESGSDEILKRINKGVNREEMVEAGLKVKESKIPLSITLISGLGGRELTREHALESATIINEISPDYVGLLTLITPGNTPLYKDIEQGKFEPLNPKEVLEETKLMVENIDTKDVVFRSNHASNYINLKGVLSQEKDIIINQINQGLSMDNVDNPYRRL